MEEEQLKIFYLFIRDPWDSFNFYPSHRTDHAVLQGLQEAIRIKFLLWYSSLHFFILQSSPGRASTGERPRWNQLKSTGICESWGKRHCHVFLSEPTAARPTLAGGSPELSLSDQKSTSSIRLRNALLNPRSETDAPCPSRKHRPEESKGPRRQGSQGTARWCLGWGRMQNQQAAGCSLLPAREELQPGLPSSLGAPGYKHKTQQVRRGQHPAWAA